MPDQFQGQGNGAILQTVMLKKYDEISSFIKTDAIPKFKKFVQTIAIVLFIVFVVSLSLVAIGTANDTKILTVLGRISLIITGIAFFFMAAPIGFLFVGSRYVTFIRSFAVYQLLITLVIWISPMPVTASLLFGLSFVGGFLALMNVLESDPGITRVITTLIFAGLLATIYFPSIRGKFDSQIVGMNEPSLVQIYPGDLKLGKIKFFLSGKPNKWYSLTPQGQYELFDQPGYNDLYQDELKPVTSEIARKLIDNENLLSRRNLQNSPSPPPEVKVTPNTTSIAPAAATNTQAQGKTVSGKVLETMDGGGYTYMQVDTGKAQQWVAIPAAKIKTGDDVSYYDGMVLQKFTSKSLNRTFDSIVFSPGLVGQVAPPAMQAKTESGSSVGAMAPYTEINVEKAAGENGYTVAELFADGTQLDGKTVRVQGKVVKFNPKVLGKNWIHLQDGSGDPLKNTHDLAVTTSAEVPKDKIITIEGIVRANKDFGSGYSYVVLVEEAKIIQ